MPRQHLRMDIAGRGPHEFGMWRDQRVMGKDAAMRGRSRRVVMGGQFNPGVEIGLRCGLVCRASVGASGAFGHCVVSFQILRLRMPSEPRGPMRLHRCTPSRTALGLASRASRNRRSDYRAAQSFSVASTTMRAAGNGRSNWYRLGSGNVSQAAQFSRSMITGDRS